jgi:thiaminase
LDKVIIQHNYRLEQASLGQIMRRLSNLNIKSPRNKYQEMLNEFFSTEVTRLVNTFNEILKCSTVEEYMVKEYNLLGNLPRKVVINEDIKKSHWLFTASIGDMCAALRQRIEFIVNRHIPEFYTSNKRFTVEQKEKYTEKFKHMQQQMIGFIDDVNEFEKRFIKTIDVAMKSKRSRK